MLPKSLKDMMKAARYASEGVNTLRGDPFIQDGNVYDTLLQLNGFTSDKVSQRYQRNNALKNYEQALLDRRGYLMDSLAMAIRTGADSERVLAKIRAFNQANPAIAITNTSIERSLGARARYSAGRKGASCSMRAWPPRSGRRSARARLHPVGRSRRAW
ncbi:putative dNA methylase [Lysobacter capsici]|uniref:PLxRFG domain-containing protein n=1 Tax=Lysobacter capsici TaxID=435897 RepID=UPI000716605E|nr:PLxRFG domain-containing protein [Lysobacter capsici]ALN85089.1 putative dNA methylase [Lysobacter capsici]